MPLWGRLHAVFVYATEGILKLCGKSGKKASAPKCPPHPHPPISSLCGSIWDGVALVTTLFRLNVLSESLSAAEKWSARKQREYNVDCIVSTDLLPADAKPPANFKEMSLFLVCLEAAEQYFQTREITASNSATRTVACLKMNFAVSLRGSNWMTLSHTYLVFTRMPGESYWRRFRSLLLYSCDVFRALINCRRLLIVHKRSRPFQNVGC